MALSTYIGYLDDKGFFIPAEKIQFPKAKKMNVMLTILDDQTEIIVNKKQEFNKILEKLREADENGFNEKFDEALNDRPKFARELDL
jgi:hypothetical protein